MTAQGERSMLDEVRAAVRALRDPDVLEAELAHRTFLYELAPLLRELDTLRDALAIVSDEVEQAIIRCQEVGSRPVVLAELGTLERVGGTVRKEWDSPRLLPVLVAAAIDQGPRADEDGQAMDPVRTVVDAIAACARLEWRTGGRAGTTGLRDYGVDPDRFCDKSRAPYKIKRTWMP